jgi:hypothetical protein
VSGEPRWALSLLLPEPDQLLRLSQYRRDHPGLAIRAGLGFWQAQIPQRDGELVITATSSGNCSTNSMPSPLGPNTASRRARGAIAESAASRWPSGIKETGVVPRLADRRYLRTSPACRTALGNSPSPSPVPPASGRPDGRQPRRPPSP